MNAGRFGQRSASVELYIPVMVYSVEVLPNEGKMTLLEEAAILFIHSTESTGTPIGIDALSAFLGLDENTTYDLVLDLWRKDRVTIDPASGELQLSDMVADAIKADGNALEDLGTAEAPVVADMLFDLVAGSTLPLTKYT